MSQKAILNDNVVLNARKVVFPENSTNIYVSDECKVNKVDYILNRILLESVFHIGKKKDMML